MIQTSKSSLGENHQSLLLTKNIPNHYCIPNNSASMETKTLLGVVNVFSISEAWRSKAKHAIHLELDLFGVNSQILLVSLPHQFTQWVMGLGKK
jgi:hypothetical protein